MEIKLKQSTKSGTQHTQFHTKTAESFMWQHNPDRSTLQLQWTQHIRTTVEKLSSGNEVYVVPVIAKMSEYSKKSGKWYSDSFYTHHNGYKVCLCVAVGHIHLSVYLYLMNGPYDDQLSWPLYGHFQVKLLNQIFDKKSLFFFWKASG